MTDIDDVQCWIEDFYKYLKKQHFKERNYQDKEIDFPIKDKNKFYKKLNEFLIETEEGKSAVNKNRIHIVNGKIIYMSIWARGRINSDDPSNIKEPEFNEWQTWIEK